MSQPRNPDSFGEPRDAGPAVLLTGANGRVGRVLARAMSARFQLRLCDLPDRGLDGLRPYGEVRPFDLTRPSEAASACADMDVLVHLAGEPSPTADWNRLLALNIGMSETLFRAASQSSCRQIIVASSVHVVGGHPGLRIADNASPNPATLYGVSKASVEALGQQLANTSTLSVTMLRIGGFRPPVTWPDAPDLGDCFVAPEDLTRLVFTLLSKAKRGYETINATSDVPAPKMSSKRMRELGCPPKWTWDGTRAVRRVEGDSSVDGT